MSEVIELRPNPGPQEDFLATSADIALFGGAAGGGKSFAALLDGLRWHTDPDFGGIIFRRESVDLTGPGSIWEEATKLFSLFGAELRQSPYLEARFPSGASFVFRHLQLESDRLAHQGKQYSWIVFEELTHFAETQFWYLWSRRRTKAKVRPYMRATCNPDPDSFVRKLIDWWIGEDGYAIPERSGVIRYFVRGDDDELIWADTREELEERFGDPERVTSFTFILSRLKDNPKIDPTYRAALLALDRVERERLLGDEERGGNWNIRPNAGELFKRSWFTVIEPEDVARLDIVRTVRVWDKAATAPSKSNPDPDWTRGGKISRLRDRRLLVQHMESLRGTPGQVDELMKRTAQNDGIGVSVVAWEDPGQAGKVDTSHTAEVLSGFDFKQVRAAQNKVAYARPVSAKAERHEILVVRGAWNEAFFGELEAFPDPKRHDDIVDMLSLGSLVLEGQEAYGYEPARPAAREDAPAPARTPSGLRGRPGLI